MGQRSRSRACRRISQRFSQDTSRTTRILLPLQISGLSGMTLPHFRLSDYHFPFCLIHFNFFLCSFFPFQDLKKFSILFLFTFISFRPFFPVRNPHPTSSYSSSKLPHYFLPAYPPPHL